MSAYDDLFTYQRETSALGQIAMRLGWDQEAIMPPGAGQQRAQEHAALEAVIHARKSNPQVGEWLGTAQAPDDIGAAHLREIRTSYERACKVPADLAAKLAETTSLSQRKWADARENEDIPAFLPVLQDVVALRREEGAALADGGDPYDALVQDYEPGITSDEIATIFDAMRTPLVDLRSAVLDCPQPAALAGDFPAEKQMDLAVRLAQVFGYDLNHGRVDKVVHPFCSGGGDDVRITTRTVENDPFNCLYSTIHETGHAMYELNVDKAYRLTALGRGTSMGVHESQSRIFENQLGRSRAFTGWLFGQMKDTFGDIGVADEEAFYAAVNRVHNGYIRTEAEELQYNLHIMMRFDLERALMRGDLQVQDLESAWNDRFLRDFGFAVDKPSNGVLQDVHWSVGLFGYFPTYALGNVYAGCLYETLRNAVPTLDSDLARGETRNAVKWLADNVQVHGTRYEPREVIMQACGGKEPTHAPLISYLQDKFSALYNLG